MSHSCYITNPIFSPVKYSPNQNLVTQHLEGRAAEPEDKATARQQPDKHAPMSMDMHTATEEL
jgi:hypothetical protein